ncbi:phytanoyl-CoA dioxygenase family protein [Mesorhizobium hawassense]|uniref:phytanoyl-CoA dioxygenase family protein n=1 Tax=Mesorhizobium hawassense TaxID=1209954 RepID=UPI001FDFA8E6|nr:phytanoyl-CoA dioxygenase family protein [Mesorhizobium hawassense]
MKEAAVARDDIDVLIEDLRLTGYTTLDAGLTGEQLDALSDDFDIAEASYAEQAAAAGYDLSAIGERDIIRVLPKYAPVFMSLAFNERLAQLLSRMLGGYYIVNQVNGLINRANRSKYAQAAFHRDIPYQHFVSSRPLAINALFALDDFTAENGATRVIPASHHREDFPSDETVRRRQVQIAVPRGSFIILDCMLYHAGSTNRTGRDRRGVNHVFTIPMLRQQLHLPSVLFDFPGLSADQKKILGFGLDEYRSVEAWLDARAKK